MWVIFPVLVLNHHHHSVMLILYVHAEQEHVLMEVLVLSSGMNQCASRYQFLFCFHEKINSTKTVNKFLVENVYTKIILNIKIEVKINMKFHVSDAVKNGVDLTVVHHYKIIRVQITVCMVVCALSYHLHHTTHLVIAYLNGLVFSAKFGHLV